MLVQFAYLKVVTDGKRSFSPATAITAWRDSKELAFGPHGGTVTLTAPSTVVTDVASKTSYYLNKAFSSVHNALTAVASTTAQISLV